MDIVREAEPEVLSTFKIPFEDKHLAEMLFRYRARNWPDSPSEAEQEQWQQYRQQRLTTNNNDNILNFTNFNVAIAESRQNELTDTQLDILEQLEVYGKLIEAQIQQSD